MSARAYVLIETAPGRSNEVTKAIKGIRGVESVDEVTGPYNVIVNIEAANLNEIGDIVTGKIHPVPGISRTVTCLAI